MNSAGGTVLPQSFFDGLSQLWGLSAYAAASLVAIGLLFSAWSRGGDPRHLLQLIAKALFVGLATVFLREWLMRLNDVVSAFGEVFQIDPARVDDRFITFISGTTPSKPNASVWDVIWDTGSVGTAIAYALLWLFGWFAFGVQYIVKLVGDILLASGWALSPLFLAFLMLRTMRGVGVKYVLGLVVLVCWPFGWVIASVVTNSLLERAAVASLLPVVIPGGASVAPILTTLLIGVWMLMSAALAPYVLYRVLMSGANPAEAFAQSVGGVMQSVLVGGVGAATTAVTGGASVGAAVAASAVGAMAAGSESAARGGGFPKTTATAVGGAAGLYRGQFVRQQASAMKDMAAAESRRASASESFTAQFADHARKSRQRQSAFPNQPHHPNPNQAAIDIDSHAKS